LSPDDHSGNNCTPASKQPDGSFAGKRPLHDSFLRSVVIVHSPIPFVQRHGREILLSDSVHRFPVCPFPPSLERPSPGEPNAFVGNFIQAFTAIAMGFRLRLGGDADPD
jgi:hypothetical protein